MSLVRVPKSGTNCALKSLVIQVVFLAVFVALTSGRVCSQDNYDCSHQIGAPCSVSKPAECYDPRGSTEVPSEPGALDVIYFTENGATGLNVSWEFPDDSSVEDLDGFLVETLSLSNNKRECFKVNIPDVCQVNTNATHPAKIFIDCFSHIVEDTKYHISVTSLPTPGLGKPPKSLQKNIDIPKVMGESHDNCSWSPIVSWQREDDNLHIIVQEAPPGSLREIYTFNLHKCMTDECAVNNVWFNGTKKDKAMGEPVSVKFQQLERRFKYLVRVTISCERYNKACKELCKGTDEPSKYYTIEKINKTESPSRKKRDTRKSSCGTRTTKPTIGLAVGLTLGLVAGVTVAVVLLIYFACAKDNNVAKDGPCYGILRGFKGRSPPEAQREYLETTKVEIIPSPQPQPAAQPEKPIVMIINSCDFAAHEDCVIAFAQFLHNHANCEVRHHRIGHEAAANKFNWICTEMKNASKVIIIHSEGSKLQYQCQEETWSADAPPEGDIFKMAFNHIISKYSKTELDHPRFLNARFCYSAHHCIITDIFGQANNYILMNHIHDLVAIIHGISLHSPNGSLKAEILHPDSYHKVELGNDLKSKIEKAAQYIKERPHYFSNTSTSEDSGLSMSSKMGSSISEGNLDHGGSQFKPGKTANTDTSIFAEMESPNKSLTEACELFHPTFARSSIHLSPGEHDEFGFIPPKDSDSDNSSEDETEISVAEINSRLFDINFAPSLC